MLWRRFLTDPTGVKLLSDGKNLLYQSSYMGASGKISSYLWNIFYSFTVIFKKNHTALRIWKHLNHTWVIKTNNAFPNLNSFWSEILLGNVVKKNDYMMEEKACNLTVLCTLYFSNPWNMTLLLIYVALVSWVYIK